MFLSVYKSLQAVLHSMMTEKQRLKHSVETQGLTTGSSSSIANPVVVSLKQTLAEVSKTEGLTTCCSYINSLFVGSSL